MLFGQVTQWTDFHSTSGSWRGRQEDGPGTDLDLFPKSLRIPQDPQYKCLIYLTITLG